MNHPIPLFYDAGYQTVELAEVNALLDLYHYLGPIASGLYVYGERTSDGALVQAQVWRHPTARQMPQNWLELSRWCITPQAGHNAGSRMMGWVRRQLQRAAPALVSYSDLTTHDGALYKASGWEPVPTHIANRYLKDGVGYPSGNGNWGTDTVATPKMRWVIWLSRKARREWDATVPGPGPSRNRALKLQ